MRSPRWRRPSISTPRTRSTARRLGKGRAVLLNRQETRQIAAFLRAVNLVENAREAISLIGKARAKPPADAGPTILEARAERAGCRRGAGGQPRRPVHRDPAGPPVQRRGAKLQRAAGDADPTLLRLAEQDLARARSLVAPNGW